MLLFCLGYRSYDRFAVGTDGNFHHLSLNGNLNFLTVDDNFCINLHGGLAICGGGSSGLSILGRGGLHRGVRFGRLAVGGG